MPVAPPHLARWLAAVGHSRSGANGPRPLDAAELAAWAAGTGRRLQGWEFQALLDASAAFCTEYHAANPLPPYRTTAQTDADGARRSISFAQMAARFNRGGQPVAAQTAATPAEQPPP